MSTNKKTLKPSEYEAPSSTLVIIEEASIICTSGTIDQLEYDWHSLELDED